MSNKEVPKLLSPQLIKAVRDNNVDQLRLLREAGECFSACDTNGCTLLHLAVGSGKVEVLEYLLTVEDIAKDALDYYEQHTALADAFFCSNKDFAMKLIENGCDINKVDRYGNTPLHNTIQNGWTEMSESLIAKGADVNSLSCVGTTPLYLACQSGLVDEIFMLLFYGADPTIVSIFRDSALDEAAHHFNKPKVQEILFNSLFDRMKTLNISTLAYAMEHGLSTFPRLLENTIDVIYTEDDLKDFFQRITNFKQEWLKMFIVKFGYIIEEIFNKCDLENVFYCCISTKRDVQNYVENLYILFESDLVSEIVAKLNSDKYSAIFWVMYSFVDHQDQLDALTELICCMLSYGVDVNTQVVDTIFMSYGYCELFKIMLHMDIKRTDNPDTCKYLVPRLIHDVNMKIEAYADNWRQYDLDTVYTIFEYFAYPKLGCNSEKILRDLNTNYGVQRLPCVPSLVELARNSARDHIIKRFNIRNSMQFYTTLERLPIAEMHKKIISFEKKLYLMSPSRNKFNFYETNRRNIMNKIIRSNIIN